MCELISSKTCPFAHRVEIVRILAKLEDKVNIIYVDPVFRDRWIFLEPYKSVDNLADLYKQYQPERTGSFSIPLLIEGNSIRNSSVDICYKWMPSLFVPGYEKWLEYFDIGISKAHYQAGHAKTEEDYQINFNKVFDFLEYLEHHLTDTYILGTCLSIVDIAIYTHLCRFDAIYYHLFKLNKKHVYEYPNIHRWMKHLYTIPAFRDTTDIDTAKRGYYLCSYHQPDKLNPFVPLGNGGFNLN